MLNATNISVSVRGRDILRDVSIKISPGQFTSVVGPNGAGKSTLLRVLSGECRPSQGIVTFNGHLADTFNPRALSLVRSVLPQHTQVQFSFSVEQIVMLGRLPHMATRKEDAAVLEEVMELAGIAMFRRRVYHTLSGGERQRVQLARVLAQVWEHTLFPRYLLLDEPTSSLDIAQQDTIFSLARMACSRNIGVLAIIHDLNQAVQYADQMLFLQAGHCIASGSPSLVFTKTNIEQAFQCPVSLFHLPGREHPLIVPDHGSQSGVVFKAINQSRNE